METLPGQISSAEIGIIATIIAALLEIYKMIPSIVMKIWKIDISEELAKTIPVCAILLGLFICYFFLTGDNYSPKVVLFNAVTCGLSAIGGRSAVNAFAKPSEIKTETKQP